MKILKRVFFAFLFLTIVLFGALILPQTVAACGESASSNKIWNCWDTDTSSWSSSDDGSEALACASTQGIVWTQDARDGNCFHYTGSCQENLDCQIPHETPQIITYSGTVYADNNENGEFDTGDVGQSGATVILWEFTDSTVSSDPQLRTKKSETKTGGDGAYRFYVTPGNYDLELVVPEGYMTTTANPMGAPSGGGTVDFRLAPPPPSSGYGPYYGPYYSVVNSSGFCDLDNSPCATHHFGNSCVGYDTRPPCDHLKICPDTGNTCRTSIMNNIHAICIDTNIEYSFSGKALKDHAEECTDSTGGKIAGFQFYIPPPSTSTPTLTVNPTSIPLKGSLVYSFTGFGSSEIVDVWVVNSPTGYTLHKTADASGNGTDTISNLSEPAGSWILKARGTSSGRSAEANFTIVDSASTTTPTACPTLAAPTGLKCNYNKINWNPVAGADRYPVRVDSAPNSWAPTTSCNVTQNPGDVCKDDVFANFQDYTFTPGTNYHVWVHAFNDCGASSSPAESWSAAAEITCDGSTASAPISPTTPPSSSNIGSIINLNVGVTNNAIAWIRSTGSDIRWDSGFTNPLPTDKYASIPGTGGMPGIIFSGALDPSFGSGQASQNPFNWQVGGSTAVSREVFTDTHSLIPTSYRFLLETADGSGIAKKTAADLCSGSSDLTNCILTPALANGVYAIDGGLNLNGASYTFPAGKNFVILVNGNLNINGKIFVPVGSTAIFSASGNIIVSSAVGEGVSAECNIATHAGCSIEGLYSADRSFVAEKNVCTGNQQRLNIAGSVIANAGRRGGSFVNKRTLCANNGSYPSVSFVERPDFMLNYPSMVTQTTRAWQEVAP